MAAHCRATVHTARDYRLPSEAMHEGWTQNKREAAYAGSRLKPTSASGRPIRQASLPAVPRKTAVRNDRGIEETSASFEAGPRLDPTRLRDGGGNAHLLFATEQGFLGEAEKPCRRPRSAFLNGASLFAETHVIDLAK